MKAITLSVLAMLVIATQAQNTGEYRVSEPYTHDNLSIFLIHGAGAPTKKLLTLQEAIA